MTESQPLIFQVLLFHQLSFWLSVNGPIEHSRSYCRRMSESGFLSSLRFDRAATTPTIRSKETSCDTNDSDSKGAKIGDLVLA